MATSWTPTRKVTAGMAGGAVATLVMVFLPQMGVTIPPTPGVESALAVLATIACSYMVSEGGEA